MGRPKKPVIIKSFDEMFEIRFNSRPAFREYMLNVIEDETIVNTDDGEAIAKYLRENIFKHENTFLQITKRGDFNYVYANIDDNVAEHRKALTYAKLNKFGFFLTSYNDIETWLYVPVCKFDVKKFNNGRYVNDQINRKILGYDSVLNKRTRNQ